MNKFEQISFVLKDLAVYIFQLFKKALCFLNLNMGSTNDVILNVYISLLGRGQQSQMSEH